MALDDGWVAEGRTARRRLLDRVMELAEKNPNLTAVTNALRRVHEVVLSHEIVTDDQRDDPDQPPDPGAPQSPGARAIETPDEDDLDGGEGGPVGVC